jgi:hypothetical protein
MLTNTALVVVVAFGHLKEDRKVKDVVSLQDDVGVKLAVVRSVVELADGALVLLELDVGSGSGTHTCGVSASRA